jgi:hypothetical protein
MSHETGKDYSSLSGLSCFKKKKNQEWTKLWALSFCKGEEQAGIWLAWGNVAAQLLKY